MWNITALPVLELPCPHLTVLRVQKHQHGLVVDELNYFPRYITPFPQMKLQNPLTAYHYFLSMCSDTALFHHSWSLQLGPTISHTVNCPHSLHILLVRSSTDSFFLQIVTLWNRLLKWCFPNHYNINFFKYRVNSYHSPHIFMNLPLTLATHTTSVRKHLPWVALGHWIKWTLV